MSYLFYKIVNFLVWDYYCHFIFQNILKNKNDILTYKLYTVLTRLTCHFTFYLKIGFIKLGRSVPRVSFWRVEEEFFIKQTEWRAKLWQRERRERKSFFKHRSLSGWHTKEVDSTIEVPLQREAEPTPRDYSENILGLAVVDDHLSFITVLVSSFPDWRIVFLWFVVCGFLSLEIVQTLGVLCILIVGHRSNVCVCVVGGHCNVFHECKDNIKVFGFSVCGFSCSYLVSLLRIFFMQIFFRHLCKSKYLAIVNERLTMEQWQYIEVIKWFNLY